MNFMLKQRSFRGRPAAAGWGGETNTARQYRFGESYDRTLHTCAECRSRLAFGYSVRIRKDLPSRPVCVECQLQVRRAA